MSETFNSNGIYFGTGRSTLVIQNSNKTSHTVISPESKNGKKIAFWGDDNRYPQNFLEAIGKNGVAGSALRVQKYAHYGQGFELFKYVYENGKKSKYLEDINTYPKIAEFFERNMMHRFWTEKIQGEETFSLSFVEHVLTNDWNEIYSSRVLETPKVRYEEVNEKTGTIDNVYYCQNWNSGTDIAGKYVAKIPLIDPLYGFENIKAYCKKKKIHKFVLAHYFPLMHEVYYPEVDWHAVFRNGWMDVANSIPQYKKNIFENQLNIKYMVYVNEEYFTRTYGSDWGEFSPDEKKKIRKALNTAIDDHLSGTKNAGKSIQSTVYMDSDGNYVKGIEVVPIDDKFKEGAFLPEATAANAEILVSMGIDATLIGAGIPGGKQSSGGGSDKREAFMILNALMRPKRDLTLDSWRFIRGFNGWPRELEGDFANVTLTTLDKNPMGVENTI